MHPCFVWMGNESSGHPETAAVLDLDVIRGSSAEFGLQKLIWDDGTQTKTDALCQPESRN